MPQKNLMPRSPFLLSVFGIVSVATIFLFLTLIFTSQDVSPKTALANPNSIEQQTHSSAPVVSLAVPGPARPGLAVRLKIPTINVDAAVESVGLTAKGAMGVPTNPADVAWFNLGPRPGETGSAVIAGHYGWIRGRAVVFNKLHSLKAGDIITVQDEQGVEINFMVRAQRSYGPSEDAAAVFTSNDGLAHLNLVTCEGVWNQAKQSYSKRLVVFADKV